MTVKSSVTRASLAAQQPGLHAPSAGGLGPVSGQETGSHMLQLRKSSLAITKNLTSHRKKILHVTVKTKHSQINTLIKHLK